MVAARRSRAAVCRRTRPGGASRRVGAARGRGCGTAARRRSRAVVAHHRRRAAHGGGVPVRRPCVVVVAARLGCGAGGCVRPTAAARACRCVCGGACGGGCSLERDAHAAVLAILARHRPAVSIAAAAASWPGGGAAPPRAVVARGGVRDAGARPVSPRAARARHRGQSGRSPAALRRRRGGHHSPARARGAAGVGAATQPHVAGAAGIGAPRR
jgi:hypothetical protein